MLSWGKQAFAQENAQLFARQFARCNSSVCFPQRNEKNQNYGHVHATIWSRRLRLHATRCTFMADRMGGIFPCAPCKELQETAKVSASWRDQVVGMLQMPPVCLAYEHHVHYHETLTSKRFSQYARRFPLGCSRKNSCGYNILFCCHRHSNFRSLAVLTRSSVAEVWGF